MAPATRSRPERRERADRAPAENEEMTSPGPVVINLPPREQAPAYRDSLSRLGEFDVQDFGSSVVVAPREGAGATREFFKAVRLCGDGDSLTDETWAPLREHPPRDHDPARTAQLVKWAQERVDADPTNMWQLLRSFRACVFVLGSHLVNDHDKSPGVI